VQDSALWSYPTPNGFLFDTDISIPNSWLLDKFAYKDSRWLVLDAQNQAVAYGNKLISADEFASQLQKAGLASPIRQLRDFLRQRPDHLEARADLLQYLRRKALELAAKKTASPDAQGSGLSPEDDLLVWAPLAQEVDATFRGDWAGIAIPFFRAEEESQPEKNSPIMKGVFARHIGKVEAALQEAPTSQLLWSAWAWMARSLENRDWKKLLSGLDAFTYPKGPTCPAPNVAVWLIGEAKAAGDWEQVVELAKAGMYFDRNPIETIIDTWMGVGFTSEGTSSPLLGYPLNSAFVPMLEGLVRLGRLEEADAVFEDVLFFFGETHREAMVSLAQSAGQPGLAQAWRTKVPDESVPRLRDRRILGQPTILTYNPTPWAPDPTPPRLVGIPTTAIRPTAFRWPESEKHWALLDKDNRMIVEGEGPPMEEPILEELEKMGYRTNGEMARDYLRANPLNANADAHLTLAYELTRGAEQRMRNSNLYAAEALDYSLDHELWDEPARNWASCYENEMVLRTLIGQDIFPAMNQGISPSFDTITNNSNILKAVADRILPKLENAIRQRPMSLSLWRAWIAWRRAGGNTRSFADLLADLAPSPYALPGTFPPPQRVMRVYYDDCVINERWPEIAKIMRPVWERKIFELIYRTNANGKQVLRSDDPRFREGRMLISALLNDGKANEADDVVMLWTSVGGEFKDADLIALARKLGYDGLADRWEKMAKEA
ncbi:MAG: hypothetical protein FWG12_07800, partial [Holophagaceae bacterium]|nr:hypothetical protein [Holophagaceae bacterium]